MKYIYLFNVDILLKMFTHWFVSTCLLVICAGNAVWAVEHLETVSDDELVQMIKHDEFVIVLFCKYTITNT